MGLGTAAWSLLFTGAFAHATCVALMRRDRPAALAMSFGALITGHAADLPDTVLAWASATMALALAGSLASAIMAAVAGRRSAFGIAAVGTPILAMLLFSGSNLAMPGLDETPVIGAVISSRIKAVRASARRAPSDLRGGR